MEFSSGIQVESILRQDLTKSIKNLEKISNSDIFNLVSSGGSQIDDFDKFCSIVRERAIGYDQLNFIVDCLKTKQREGFQRESSDRDASNQLLTLLKVRNDFHLKTFRKLKFKFRQIFDEVRGYIGHIQSDPYQSSVVDLLSENIAQLSQQVANPEPEALNLVSIEDQFKKINQKLLEEPNTSQNDKLYIQKDSTLNHLMTKKRDKSIMVQAPNPETTPNTDPEMTLDAVKINSKYISSIDEVNVHVICFSVKDSYLMVRQSTHGENSDFELEMIQKKNGRLIYYEGGVDEGIKSIIHLKGSYYLYNSSKSQILRKTEGGAEAAIWDEREITTVEDPSKVIQASVDGSAIIINIDDMNLAVVEVAEDGSAGRELLILNESKSDISCFQALSGQRILTVTEEGLIVLYVLDLEDYIGYDEVAKHQIELKTERKENSMSVALCEKFEVMALVIRDDECLRGSRIQIYSLSLPQEEALISLKAEIDIWEDCLPFYRCLCLSQYLGDMLMVYGQSCLDGTTHTYSYDILGGELLERTVQRIGWEGFCLDFQRVGDQICGISITDKIVRFKF